MLNSRPGIPAHACKCEQTIAEFVDWPEQRKSEERDRIAPVIEPISAEEAHRCLPPMHLVLDPKFLLQGKGRVISFADEMVEALERHACEIEMAGHTTWFRRGFNQVDL